MTTTGSAAAESAMGGLVTVPPFAVIGGAQVQPALQGRENQIVELVEATYRLHSAGDSVNPPSYFLRFPDRPSARIIALPASIGGPLRVDGLKWISSFPQNVAAGLPRASAVLILNDHDTGYPFACLEASIISATRTAALAASAADWLSRGRPRPARVGFFGTGLIARYIHTFLDGTGWSFDQIGVHDLSADSAAGFRGYLEQLGTASRITVYDSTEQLIRSSDLIIFATIAGQPHVSDLSWFEHNPLVLHVSLRDLAPEILLASANIVDDIEHCLKASHLAASSRTDHGQPELPARHAGRRDGGAGDHTGGPASGVLSLRPRSARPRGGEVRLRRGRPLRPAARHRRILPRSAPVRMSSRTFSCR